MPEADQLEACEAFRTAGQKVGLEIWRIEKLEPVKQAETSHGKFYIGDAYIILNTKARPGQNRFDYDLHFWLGELCSQDEMGSAAIRTVELDELVLGGTAVQYRETQGHESKLFLSYFKSGIRYLEGGVEGGLKKVDPDSFEKRLFQVKGKKNIRIGQVECNFSSLNQGDTFVLDCGRNIYVWVGPTTEKKEKLGGVELAKRIRDEERGGKAHIHVVEDDWNTNEEFFKALGKREKTIRAANDADDDDVIRKIDQEIVLYEIVETAEGDGYKEDVHPVAQKPLTKSLLNSKNCYVLDVGCAGIYVWLGRQCRTSFKTKVWSSVNKFLESRKYPRWVAVTKVVDGGETSAFKQYFKGWAEAAPLAPSVPTNGHVAEQDYSGAAGIDAQALHKRAGKAEQWMPDDASGKKEVWRVERNELVAVPERAHGVFFGGDCYIILYTYGVPGNEQYIIYFWQGRNSTTDEKTASAGQAVALDNKLGGRAVQIRVVEFKEPLHFMKIFGGKLIVFAEGHVTGYQNVHCHAQYDPSAVYMFQICGETEETTRAIQVKSRSSCLNSNDLFIISKGKKIFVWLGKFCSEQEIAMARHMGQYITKDREPAVVLKEGEEPEDFWDLLGDKEPYKNTKRQLSGAELEFSPRLFQCSMSSGRFAVEEIVSFCQDDMDETDVMILDTHDEIFIWLGNKCHEFEKKEAAKTAKNYLLSDPDGRTPDNTLIIVVRQGFEPPQFTGCFVGWDTNKWAEGKTFKDICKELGQENAGISLLDDEVKKYTSFYSLDVLQRKVPPEGVDVLRKEMYLNPEDFQNVFNMTKDEFNKLPEWKRTNLRKEKDLF